MTILCIGLNSAIDTTVSLDTLTLGAVNRAMDNQSYPAGKALNVASLLSQLGVAVVMTGFLGADNNSDFLALFDRLGIDNHCINVQGKTRQNIKLTESEGRTTDVNGIGFELSEQDKAKFFEILPNLCKHASMVVVSGSLPRGFGLTDWQKLLRLIKMHNERLIVDTSGEALAAALDFEPFLIKPNKDELIGAIGNDDVYDKVLSGVRHVVLSDGEKGVVWRAGEQTFRATAPKVTVKSTVGAGDTLLSGMIFGLLNDDAPTDTLRRAAAMAAHTVTVIGVEVPSIDRLTQLTKEINIMEIV